MYKVNDRCYCEGYGDVKITKVFIEQGSYTQVYEVQALWDSRINKLVYPLELKALDSEDENL